MEGEHTIDVGILAAPVIVEYLKQASEVSKIKYKVSDQEVRAERAPKKINGRLLEEILEEMEQTKDSPETEELEASAEDIKTSSKGLMARKTDIKGDNNGD